MDKNRVNTFAVLRHNNAVDSDEEGTQKPTHAGDAKDKRKETRKEGTVGETQGTGKEAHAKSKHIREEQKPKGVPAQPHPQDRKSGQAYASQPKKGGHGAFNEGDPVGEHTKEYLEKGEDRGGKGRQDKKPEEEKPVEPPKKSYKEYMEQMRPNVETEKKSDQPFVPKKTKVAHVDDHKEVQKRKGDIPTYHVAINTANAELLNFQAERAHSPRQRGERHEGEERRGGQGRRFQKREDQPRGENQPQEAGEEHHQQHGAEEYEGQTGGFRGGNRRGGFRGGQRRGGPREGGQHQYQQHQQGPAQVQYVVKGENGDNQAEAGHEAEGHGQVQGQGEEGHGRRGGYRGGGFRGGRGSRRGGPRHYEGGEGEERPEREEGEFRGGNRRGGYRGGRPHTEGGQGQEGGERPHYEKREGGRPYREGGQGGYGGHGGHGGHHQHRGGQGNPSFRPSDMDFPALN